MDLGLRLGGTQLAREASSLRRMVTDKPVLCLTPCDPEAEHPNQAWDPLSGCYKPGIEDIKPVRGAHRRQWSVWRILEGSPSIEYSRCVHNPGLGVGVH